MHAIGKVLIGAITVCAAVTSPPAHAAATFQGLGDLPGHAFRSVAYGLSGDGSTVVGDSNAADSRAGYYQHAYRWSRQGGMQDLGSGIAGGVSRDGSVVAGLSNGAFRWTAATGMVNIGSGRETSIRELAETICRLMRFEGAIRWDASKPDGQPRRWLDTSRAHQAFAFSARTSLEDGLRNTVEWYMKTR